MPTSAVNIIRDQLTKKKGFHHRTYMTIQQIICLLEVCLKNTNFVFQGKYYGQLKGPAMGSPISPIVANLYMEAFETKAINTSPDTPSLWKRYVDDIFVIIKSTHKEELLDHINFIDNKIMQCQRCSTQATSRTMEYQHTIWQSWKIHQPSCESANYHTHQLKMKTLLLYIVTCK